MPNPQWSTWTTIVEHEHVIVRVRMQVDAPFRRQMQVCPASGPWQSFTVEQNDMNQFQQKLSYAWRY